MNRIESVGITKSYETGLRKIVGNRIPNRQPQTAKKFLAVWGLY